MSKNLSDMIRSEDYTVYESEALGLQANIINGKADPEVVTHQDIINCWVDYLVNLDLTEAEYDAFIEEINTCEARHDLAGTLEDVVYDYAPQ